MPFDPNQPQQGELIDAVQLRNQFNGLKTLIDNVPAGPPGPQGPAGPEGPAGAGGPGGAARSARERWTAQQLSYSMEQTLAAAMAGSAANMNQIQPLQITISDPPTQSDVQAVLDKLNELIAALRR